MKKAYIHPAVKNTFSTPSAFFPALAAGATAASATFGLMAARKMIRAYPMDKEINFLQEVIKDEIS